MKKLSFIIADDHPFLRKGVKQIISDDFPGAIITETTSAEETLSIIKKGKYDLLISDISMPGLSGIELLKKIKADYPDIPVLVLSMYPEEQYAIRAFKAGASGYISKDMASAELVNAINKILNGKKYISSSMTEILADNFSQVNPQIAHETLSDREFEIFKMIASGKNNSFISEKLGLSVNTISTQRSRILKKMNLQTNSQLTRYALENKLI